MSLIHTIRSFVVPPQHVGLWWLGQAGFIIKSPGGVTLAIDPYLTNSCSEPAAKAGYNMDRLFPPPIDPAELDVTAIAFTHSHPDHCDPPTIAAYRSTGRTGPYIAPGETMDKLIAACAVPREEILLIWPNKEHRLGDMRVRASFAVPYGSNDLTHVGYIVFIDNGPTLYFTGDTDYNDVLGAAADHHPDILVTVINGAFRNLSCNDATRLTLKINPSIVIPCHHDLFPDNSVDPRLFRTCLQAAGIASKYRLLQHGEIFLFPQ